MTYSIIGLLALLINAIINHDVLWGIERHGEPQATDKYRRYLLSVMVYYVTDALWGFLNEGGLKGALFIDTTVYFAAMAASVFLWTRYVIAYLDERHAFSTFLRYAGECFLAFEAIALILNLFHPVLFWVDEGGYHAGPLRYATLGAQILLFLLTAIYTLASSSRAKAPLRRRYRTIGIFCLSMILFVTYQVRFPLLPFYAIGSMLGACVLHAFVLEDEKDEYRRMLEKLVEKELELDRTQQLAYRDSLTGVKSKHAYVEAEERMNQRIVEGDVDAFAVAVFDLDGLKHVNDTQGHEAGDRYIKEGCQLVCTVFDHSPVFRIGGDEFVAILEGRDYEARHELVADFERQVDENLRTGNVIISSGFSDFASDHDRSFQDVFERADAQMYARKGKLKSAGAHVRA